MDWNVKLIFGLSECYVALFTRAWIEIDWNTGFIAVFLCRPLYEGVDWNISSVDLTEWLTCVALFTRAWIEIDNGLPFSFSGQVALFTRAWIEIHLEIFSITCRATSPSLRGRGLKWNYCWCVLMLDSVALFTRAWIEIVVVPRIVRLHMSPSLRGRGLKYIWCFPHTACPYVALFTRAWIEIVMWRIIWLTCASRPLYEGVDWNKVCKVHPTRIVASPSLRGRGLKYTLYKVSASYRPCRPLYEGVDWNFLHFRQLICISRRPLYEGVDWNKVSCNKRKTVSVSPSLRGRGLKWVYRLRSKCRRKCRPLYEGVDWNKVRHIGSYHWLSSPSLRGRGLK